MEITEEIEKFSEPEVITTVTAPSFDNEEWKQENSSIKRNIIGANKLHNIQHKRTCIHRNQSEITKNYHHEEEIYIRRNSQLKFKLIVQIMN